MKKYIGAVIAFLLSAQAAHADWISDYVRYSTSPDLGQIIIESGPIRGKHAVLHAQNAFASLAGKGIFVGEGNVEHVYHRVSSVHGHKIDCQIVIHPPFGHGYGGNNYTAELVTKIDGKEKVHCNLGYLAQENNLHVDRVVIYPEDQFIEVSATAGDSNRIVHPPLKHCLFSDSHVISNESLIYAR